MYRSALADHDAAEFTTIPRERISCPVVLVSGDDQMWPTTMMAETIAAKIRADSQPTHLRVTGV
jgi:hypothetical protein